MKTNRLEYYAHHADSRGEFLGLINRGTWKEVNYVVTRAGEVRGNHFHKSTREIVFLLKGEADVELQDVNDPGSRATVHLSQGEGVEVVPYVLHTMRYLSDSEQISLLDRAFDPANPDLNTVES